ncbi:hypothetical protein VNO77_16131 [Canavalia gladiata]|uniref:Uncharacterized protein n=1 Tax=Canavalia gladiata TaxID=3824 RepID=A0AAN9QRU2_CANGL
MQCQATRCPLYYEIVESRNSVCILSINRQTLHTKKPNQKFLVINFTILLLERLEYRVEDMLRTFVERIQKGLSHFVPRRYALSHLQSEDHATSVVADDVMEGYFAVLAVKGEETKRFIVGLDYLSDPAFLGLLDQAREEYGFRQEGTLAVPCQPQELQKILDGLKA